MRIHDISSEASKCRGNSKQEVSYTDGSDSQWVLSFEHLLWIEWSRCEKKQITLLLRVTVNCIVHYPCKLFKVASICLDIFLTPCDQGTCILMKHCCITYVYCSNENLQEFFPMFICVHTPQLSCNTTHGNLTVANMATVVPNAVHHHNQSISKGTADWDTVWSTEMLRCCIMLAVHLTFCAQSWTFCNRSGSSFCWKLATCQTRKDVQSNELVINGIALTIMEKWYWYLFWLFFNLNYDGAINDNFCYC